MRFLGPHSAGEGPHLVPISLKFGSPSGPHFEKSGSPGLVGTVTSLDVRVVCNHGLSILFVRDTEKLFGRQCDMQLGEINSNQLPIRSFAISDQLISCNQQATESANDNEALADQRIVSKLAFHGAFHLLRSFDP